ncbi:hypothetical protein RHMOL_Rhmol07G0039900 [Rhododendron molle]|uniref:Uncharacterized protein n=1 Tax=Rhododendron molle TaxID=49168 RepID=A0ACC0MY68_RHOML|nr:hypothetical protein RHMOL_Rhmol07G0039900 [Rhododendron molle]
MKRKGSQKADIEATVQTSSRTPIKIKTRPESKKVNEKKRKRTNRGDEEVIDLNTPTKRVTRSSEALKKMQMDKDMEEREDTGIKRKTRHQVSQGGSSNKKPDVKQKNLKYIWLYLILCNNVCRSTLNIMVKLIRSIPTGEFTPLQVQEIKKTPFAEILLGVVESNLDEAYVRKSDADVLKLVKQYEGSGWRFKLGGKSVKFTAKEVTLIFGIQSGHTRIVLNPTPRVPKSDFADRLCPGPKGQRILTTPLLRKFFAKTVEGTSLQDAKDLARVLCLLLIGTLFFASTQARVSWGYLEFVEFLDNSTSYDWATFITDYVIEELNKRASSKPTKVGGCIMRLMVFSSELEPNNEEEELYRFSQVPEHEADVKDAKLNTTVDNSGDEGVHDKSDEETDSDQDEVVTVRGIIRKLTIENAGKDRIIMELRRENEEKNATIAELKRKMTKHPQTPTPGFRFDGISAQFDKDHLEHENINLQTEIGGLIIEKDIVEEKLELAGDIIDDFVTHTVTQTYQPSEKVGEKESKAKKVDERREKHEIENVEEEEEEEEEEGQGGGFEIVRDEGGPEHIMVADADVDSTTVAAYTSILECDTPKRKRGKTKVRLKSSSLTRGVKKTFTRVEKRLDDYVYVDLKKGAKKSSKQKWNPSEAPLIHLLQNTDANLLRQIVDCSDADIHCTVWTNDVTREVVPLEEIMKLLQGGDVSNWMIDGFALMLTIEMGKHNLNHGKVAFFPCTIWTMLHNEKSDMRTVLLDAKLHCVFENVRQHGTKYYRYLVFPMNGNGDKPMKITPYHWTILLFDVRKKNWMHYNSLKKRDGRDPMLKDATIVKKYVENYMKDRHAELKNQNTGTEILFEEQNFDAPIYSPQHAPQQENTS